MTSEQLRNGSVTRLYGPGPLRRHMQPQAVPNAQSSLAFDPGGDAAPRLGGRLEPPTVPGMHLLDSLGGLKARPVLEIDDQGHAVRSLQPGGGWHSREVGNALDHHRGADMGVVQRFQPHRGRYLGHLFDGDKTQLPRVGDGRVARMKR